MTQAHGCLTGIKGHDSLRKCVEPSQDTCWLGGGWTRHLGFQQQHALEVVTAAEYIGVFFAFKDTESHWNAKRNNPYPILLVEMMRDCAQPAATTLQMMKLELLTAFCQISKGRVPHVCCSFL